MQKRDIISVAMAEKCFKKMQDRGTFSPMSQESPMTIAIYATRHKLRLCLRKVSVGLRCPTLSKQEINGSELYHLINRHRFLDIRPLRWADSQKNQIERKR